VTAPTVELGERDVRYADVPTGRIGSPCPVAAPRQAPRQALRPSRESQAQGTAADAAIEDVSLVARRGRELKRR